MSALTAGVIIPTMISRIDKAMTAIKSLSEQTELPDQVIVAVQRGKNDSTTDAQIRSRLHATGDHKFPLEVVVKSDHGLSKNRNTGLELAKTDVVHLLDDDCVMPENAMVKIKQAYATADWATAIAFQTATPEGMLRKNYYKRPVELGKRNFFRVSSVELSFRNAFVKEQEIQFDERYGLGGQWVVGEEVVFLSEIQKCGGRVLFVPTVVCIHGKDSTGTRFDDTMLVSLGAVLRNVFGSYAPLFAALYVGKKTFNRKINSPFNAFLKIRSGYSSVDIKK
ncbi:glycosyltransferase family 2 protein [Pseudomonadota bacterium]